MARIQFHFRLGEDDVEARQIQGGFETIQVSLAPTGRGLGHCLGTTLEQLRRLGVVPTEIGVDLLLLGSSVYTADKYVDRAKNSEDSWTREIEVSLPVSNPDLWNAWAERISKALQFLTGDRWTLAFRGRPASRAILAVPIPKLADTGIDRIALFSGGLDSFIGALDLLEEEQRLLLVSHSAVSTDSGRQTHLADFLTRHYAANRPMHLRASIRFRAKHLGNRVKEDTERSRSFLFFSIAGFAATALPAVETIVVPENGLIALNVPLEEVRLGALSTRTAHPFFIARMNEMLAGIGIAARLSNPYLFKTKGEMVRECHNQEVLTAEHAQTISCSSPNSARIQHLGADHCGYCMPCIIRRAAFVNSTIPDATKYGVPDLHAQELPSNHPRGEHIRAFEAAVLRLNKSILRAGVFVHESGPLNDHPDAYERFAGVYLRGLQEVETLLSRVVTRPR